MRVVLVLCAILATAGAALGATVVSFPMDAQVRFDPGASGCDGIYSTNNTPPNFVSFEPADPANGEPVGWTREHIVQGNGWYYGPYINFKCATGADIDISSCLTVLKVDLRFFKTTGYGDAPIFLRLYTYDDAGTTVKGYRDYGVIYKVNSAPWNDPVYPAWSHKEIALNDLSRQSFADTGQNGGVFDPHKVNRMRFYGTDWSAPATGAQDYVDVKNFVITNDPVAPVITTAWGDAGRVNVPYTKQLATNSCAAVDWTLSAPGTTLTINSAGLVSGWTPTAGDLGNTYTVTATATNGGGSDTKTWTITVVGQYDLAYIPFDAQIDVGGGPAITSGAAANYWSFEPPDGTLDNFGRFHIAQLPSVDGWYRSFVDFNKAGFGTLDLSSCETRMSIDARYFQTLGYGDAWVVARFYDLANKTRTWWFHRDTNDLHYPTWQSHLVYLNNATMSPWDTGWSDAAFDPTKVYKVELFGTDWVGTGSDYVDLNNLLITNQPQVPVIAPVLPDPHAAFVNTPYSKQMSVTPCTNVTWTLTSNGTGATIDGNGLVSGWTPTAAQLNNTFTFTATATGPAGSSSVTWHAKVKPTQLADSGLDTPWPTVHGNNAGTQSSDDPRLILNKNWARGAVADWMLDVTSKNPLATRANDRSSIVFDNAGNLYWKSMGATDCHLCSATPTGTLRWISNSFGTPVSLGGNDTSSPVVGAGQRVYVLTSTGVAAVNKEDGDLVWMTTLSGSNLNTSGNRLTPVLHNGKLYVLGTGAPTRKLFQVDDLSGAVDWSADINGVGMASVGGQMTLVPDAFGAGKHGLYFNGDSGSGTDGKPEMHGITIDTTANTASLAWSSEGGKVARSHVIYLAATHRVCTHTWNDYGNAFYTWNLDGTGAAATKAGSGAHGYEDFGAVDFDGNDVLASGTAGRISRYVDVAAPTVPAATEPVYNTDFESYSLGDIVGQDNWALDNDANHTYGSPQIVADPTGSGRGNVLMLDPPGTDGGWQGCGRVAAASKGYASVEWDQYRTDLNDNFWIADDIAYSGWYTYGWDSNGSMFVIGSGGPTVAMKAGVWQHVRFTFIAATGQVALDIDGTVNFATLQTPDPQLNGIDFEVEPTAAGGAGGPMYIDNIVIKQGDPAPFIMPFGTNGWYQTNSLFGEGRGIGALYKDENGKSIYINGTNATPTSTKIIGFNVTDSQLYTIAAPDPAIPAQDEARLFEYDTAGVFHPQGGPVLGPAVAGVPQHIYFFNSDSVLVALTFVRPIPGDFNEDGYVDMNDFDAFMQCVPPTVLSGPTIPVTPECASRDLDGDNDIDQDDFGVFQRCFAGSEAKASPDCAK